jgi:hypothetical protein
MEPEEARMFELLTALLAATGIIALAFATFVAGWACATADHIDKGRFISRGRLYDVTERKL